MTGGLSGCAPGGLLGDDSVLGLALSGTSGNESDPTQPAHDGKPADSDVSEPTAQPDHAAVILSGALAGRNAYELLEVPGVERGERLVIENANPVYDQSLFTVALFDGDMNLLSRTPSFPVRDVVHELRRPSRRLFVGIIPTYEDSGGAFRLGVRREAGAPPPPVRQVVYLNFDGARDINLHVRRGVSFGPFDAAVLGSAYAGQTDAVRRAIVETMREDYTGYDVRIVSSDEGPPPVGAYSTVHFGGEEPGLLGLADSVDRYNENPVQHAIVYAASFAPFEVMELTPEEMGLMIGNVGSHELGHLLGLYHTRNPADLMDTTGTAWDLAADQRFTRAALEPSVFPVGMEDAPTLLADTVGRDPVPAFLDRPVSSNKLALRSAVRGLMELEIPAACGLCLDPEK